MVPPEINAHVRTLMQIEIPAHLEPDRDAYIIRGRDLADVQSKIQQSAQNLLRWAETCQIPWVVNG